MDSAKEDNNTSSNSIVSGASDTIQRGLDAISQIEQNADLGQKTNDLKKEPTDDGSQTISTKTTTTADETPKTEGSNGIKWLASVELGYSVKDDPLNNSSSSEAANAVCFYCGSSNNGKPLSKCAKCRVAQYCSRACQVADWKNHPLPPQNNSTNNGGYAGMTISGHKHSCQFYKKVGPNMTFTDPNHKQTAREAILAKIRFYACPYAVHNMTNLGIGKGFLFLQSEFTLAQLSLPSPIMCDGRPLSSSQPRSVLLHYLTIGEYDSELCRDDFEMASVRNALKDALDATHFDEKKQVVFLCKFRCGHLSLAVAPLVPDYGICLSLAGDYYAEQGSQALQLNLDDM